MFRPETESYTIHTAALIAKNLLGHHCLRDGETTSCPKPLRIVDLCTGSGCIALLLHALLAPKCRQLAIIGVDVSRTAVELAKVNLKHNVQLGLLADRALKEVHFCQGNVLGPQTDGLPGVEGILRSSASLIDGHPTTSAATAGSVECDVLISNPPYISPMSFRDGTTSRSVRIFEPTLALVPPTGVYNTKSRDCEQADIFYHHIVALSSRVRAKLTVLECGDRIQADRVVAMCKSHMGKGQRRHKPLIEIYSSDESDADPSSPLLNSGPCAVIIHNQVDYQ